MAGGAQATAPVAGGPGGDGDRAAGTVVEYLDCLLSKASAGVFHHLEDAEVEIFYGDAVNLAHLSLIYMGDREVAVGEKQLCSHLNYPLTIEEMYYNLGDARL